MSLIVVDFTTTSVSCIESDLASCPKSWVRVGDDYNEAITHFEPCQNVDVKRDHRNA